MKGIIFDIKEFSLNDGAGIRTTVFMKGCPLSCIWCHNPEGLSANRELYVKRGNCQNCGLCQKPCGHEDCKPFGRCLHICPRDLVSIAGVEWESHKLTEKLLSQADFLKSVGGGVSFSGGEPLLQHKFVGEVLNGLDGKIHRAIETSGYADSEIFEKIISKCDFVYMDLKLFDNQEHKKYCGVGNEKILKNAEILKKSGVEYIFRIPLVPCITDTEENLRSLAEFVDESPVELLPYNRLAPAKYKNAGREFTKLVDSEKEVIPRTELFKNAWVR